MAVRRRITRLNSLLKEVISEVITKDVKHQALQGKLITVTRVDITNDLHYAKVYISIIGDDKDKEESIKALKSASGFISVNASKKVVMHHFPQLTFFLDDSVDKQMRIHELLSEIKTKEEPKDETPNGTEQ